MCRTAAAAVAELVTAVAERCSRRRKCLPTRAGLNAFATIKRSVHEASLCARTTVFFQKNVVLLHYFADLPLQFCHDNSGDAIGKQREGSEESSVRRVINTQGVIVVINGYLHTNVFVPVRVPPPTHLRLRRLLVGTQPFGQLFLVAFVP